MGIIAWTNSNLKTGHKCSRTRISSTNVPVGHGPVIEPRVVPKHDVVDLRQVLDQHRASRRRSNFFWGSGKERRCLLWKKYHLWKNIFSFKLLLVLKILLNRSSKVCYYTKWHDCYSRSTSSIWMSCWFSSKSQINLVIEWKRINS